MQTQIIDKRSLKYTGSDRLQVLDMRSLLSLEKLFAIAKTNNYYAITFNFWTCDRIRFLNLQSHSTFGNAIAVECGEIICDRKDK